MINIISKYFAGELTPKEIALFLPEISENKNLKREFIATQQLMAYTDLLSWKGDEEKVRERLIHFMQKV